MVRQNAQFTQYMCLSPGQQTVYDAHGNVVGTVDAKGQSAGSAFDARDRRTSETDRLGVRRLIAALDLRRSRAGW
ncbi:MAG: RHS repeat domain-containing protein [Thermoguttaceae bacterium]|nr:RHS repeat domain-containing protein [Thermoguttaceae bacterium]